MKAAIDALESKVSNLEEQLSAEAQERKLAAKGKRKLGKRIKELMMQGDTTPDFPFASAASTDQEIEEAATGQLSPNTACRGEDLSSGTVDTITYFDFV